jgi:hypothetical protein
METITIYPLKEKKFIYSQIKKLALENNGILFGCYVMTNIISEYYKKEYFINNNIKNYWDDKYDEKTILRLLVCNCISIYFNNEAELYIFIAKLRKNFDMRIKYKNIRLEKMNYYFKQITIFLNYGKTLSSDGFYLEINILLYTYYCYYTEEKLEPPFNNTGFLSYIFIQDKNGIRISNNTGTNLDLLSKNEKIDIENIFIDLIIKNETYLIKTNFIYTDKKITENIIKLLYEYNYINWNIKNCDIKTIYENETKIIIHDNKKFNKDCFITTLNFQEISLNINDLLK